MSPLSNCPICKRPLSSYFYYLKRVEFNRKICDKTVTHCILFDSKWVKPVKANYIYLRPNSTLIVEWQVLNQLMHINGMQAPYIDPDFKKYSSLIKKITSYLPLL